jgi:CRP/FNR family transcriptional regulator
LKKTGSKINEIRTIRFIKAGEGLIRAEQYIKAIPLLLDGVIKVMCKSKMVLNLCYIFKKKEKPAL